ncbi:MAG: alpha/beta fold hydrolase [Pseudomonadales bacterium]|nr:alpha/beta fold hydrolase [Pseudomonadales bacterium]MBO6595081.1 alpha/beta fold hydrolase [Pseudomonadales bacterium]MBO6821360.1 alpha/beta fold hydrolase [Pseudomonadales bacterium]
MTTIIHLPGNADSLLILAHGAGAPCSHPHMNAIAGALADVGIGTLRFNFPFMDEGRRRVDKIEVCLDAFDEILKHARENTSAASLFIGGHSFGGRMSTHYMAERNAPDIQGLMLFSFPLHVAKKPDTKRALHLPDIERPLLFLSGTRDALAEPDLLEPTVGKLSNAKLHWLETADHSFKILKRTRTSTENVYAEAARVSNEWITSLS